MEITISITSQEILCNPNVFDEVKELVRMVAGTKNEVDFKVKAQNPDTKTPEITMSEVRKALGELSKEKGSQVSKNILKTFNVDKVTELLEKDYLSVIDAVKAVKV